MIHGTSARLPQHSPDLSHHNSNGDGGVAKPPPQLHSTSNKSRLLQSFCSSVVQSSQTPHRLLLLLFILSAQILFIAIIRLGPSATSYYSSLYFTSSKGYSSAIHVDPAELDSKPSLAMRSSPSAADTLRLQKKPSAQVEENQTRNEEVENVASNNTTNSYRDSTAMEESKSPRDNLQEENQSVKSREDQEQSGRIQDDQDQSIRSTEDPEQSIRSTEDQEQSISSTEDAEQSIRSTEDQEQSIRSTEDWEQSIRSTEDPEQSVRSTEDQEQYIRSTEDPEQSTRSTEDQEQSIRSTEDQEQSIRRTEDQEQSISSTEDQEQSSTSTDMASPLPALSSSSLSSDKCRDGYIYVYELPAMFNHDIVANCSGLSPWADLCPTIANGGLGQSIGESSPLGQIGSWYESDQFTSELLFHNRILQHPCVTNDTGLASGFYVPFYAGLDVGRFLWGYCSAEKRDNVSSQLLEWLSEQESWRLSGGWNHFMMVGRITWDFRRSKPEDWGSGFFHHPLIKNMTRLLIERNPWDHREMGVPYPTNFHPQSDSDLRAWQDHIRSHKRATLFSFAGAPRSQFPNDFRGILLNQCKKAKPGSCRYIDCSNRTCEDNQKSLELFMDSKFCLQPRGDSFTRRSTFECLLAGSIPVFFWHRSAYFQYKWHLPEDASSYSVFISKDEMRNGTKIRSVLKSLSSEKVRAMREVVIGMVPRIVYALSGFSLKEEKDAFDIAIDGVMRKFKRDPGSSVER